MFRNVATEMSPDRNSQTCMSRYRNSPDPIGKTEKLRTHSSPEKISALLINTSTNSIENGHIATRTYCVTRTVVLNWGMQPQGHQ